MSYRENLSYCIEAAAAELHARTAADQYARPEKTSKLIALLRSLPSPVRLKLVELNDQKNLPAIASQGDRTILGYGCEAVVYKIDHPTTDPFVLKRYRSRGNVETDMSSRMATYVTYRQSLGDIIVPTVFFQVPKQQKTPALTAGCIQPYIPGKPFFLNPELALQEEVRALYDGTAAMLETHGALPDFANDNNVLVDDEGRLYDVDTGGLKPLTNATTGAMGRNLDLIAEYAGERQLIC